MKEFISKWLSSSFGFKEEWLIILVIFIIILLKNWLVIKIYDSPWQKLVKIKKTENNIFNYFVRKMGYSKNFQNFTKKLENITVLLLLMVISTSFSIIYYREINTKGIPQKKLWMFFLGTSMGTLITYGIIEIITFFKRLLF